MIIHEGFYIIGFTRIDKGEAGAVFVHYGEPMEDARKAEIRSSPYGSRDAANYSISIPRPQARQVIACAIVTRTSKNCYQATCYDEKRIVRFKADTLDGLRRTVAEFFKEVSA